MSKGKRITELELPGTNNWAHFSSNKWEWLPTPDIVIDRMNNFDATMTAERKRTPEPPPTDRLIQHPESVECDSYGHSQLH